MQAKVVGGMLGGAFATITIWLLNTYTGAAVPGEVGAALTTIFGTGIAWMVSETGVAIPVVGPVALRQAQDVVEAEAKAEAEE